MNPSDSNQSHNSQPTCLSAVEIQSNIKERLKALKADPAEVAPEPQLSPRWRVALFVIASILATVVVVFLFVAAIRQYSPNATVLGDGWTHVVDRQWGFEVDFPAWHTKSSDGPQTIRYESRFPNSTNIRVRVTNWKYKRSKTDSAANELAAILKRERQLRPVEVLIDRSTDPVSPMIDFISTCGAPAGQWKVRERIFIHNEVMVRIDIVTPELSPPKDLERFLDSVRWLP